MYICVCVYMCVYIYIYMWRKIDNKVIQVEGDIYWVGIETAIFGQCSPGTVETQRLYQLCHGPRSRQEGYLVKKRGAIDNNYGRQ